MPDIRELVLSAIAFPSESHPANLYLAGSPDISVDAENASVVGQQISLGTWFNAAPAGWWSRVFGARKVVLRVKGQGNLKVWGAFNGKRVLVTSVQISGDWSQEFTLDSNYEFLWVEVSHDQRAVLETAEWSLVNYQDEETSTPAKVTVVVPTFRLEEEALSQVQRLLAPSLADVVARVLVIDQGNTVAASPNYTAVAEQFGARFELFEQGNFGGSGGYARGMIESLHFPNDAVLLLDDDAVIEPASLRRALVISEALGRNTIVGTGLISAELPTQIASLAEGINRRTFNWGSTDGVGEGRELTEGTPESWNFLASSAKSEYSGWWGTLLPAGAIRRIGLPAPFFLKWDDAEYGLRAAKAGIQTVTIPGISAWHPTWAAKGTVSSWSSWPMHRNRLTVAAAYGSGVGVIGHSLIHQIKHVLSLQYSSAELWNKGIEEFLASSDWLSTGLIDTRNRAQTYLDLIPKVDCELSEQRLPKPNALTIRVLRSIIGLFTSPHLNQVGSGEGIDFSWSESIGRDAFIINRAGKTEVLMRDPARARRILVTTFKNHSVLWREWRKLRRVYADELTYASRRWSEILQLDSNLSGQ